jgi:hypothetical protein
VETEEAGLEPMVCPRVTRRREEKERVKKQVWMVE